MVSKLFTFRSVEKLRGAIETMVDELIEPLAEAGGGDLVTQLASLFPSRSSASCWACLPRTEISSGRSCSTSRECSR
jgi:cytochrome P450